MDDSELLHENETKEYQHIIGMSQWLITMGRFDIHYDVSSLSRFSTAPRRNHLNMARKVLGYLKKYPRKGYVVSTVDMVPMESEPKVHHDDSILNISNEDDDS